MTWSLCFSTWEWWMSSKATRQTYQECLQRETCICPSLFTRVLWRSTKKAPKLQQLLRLSLNFAVLILFQSSVQTAPSFSSSGTTKPIASCSAAGSPLHKGTVTMWGTIISSVSPPLLQLCEDDVWGTPRSKMRALSSPVSLILRWQHLSPPLLTFICALCGVTGLQSALIFVMETTKKAN